MASNRVLMVGRTGLIDSFLAGKNFIMMMRISIHFVTQYVVAVVYKYGRRPELEVAQQWVSEACKSVGKIIMQLVVIGQGTLNASSHDNATLNPKSPHARKKKPKGITSNTTLIKTKTTMPPSSTTPQQPSSHC